MSSEGKKSRKKSIFVMCSIAVIFVLCCVTAVLLLNHPVLICSDAGGVEFVTEEDRITYVSVRGQYPYLRVVCPLDKEVVDLCQYFGHKKLNFSPSITYAERIIS